ncbi:MAG: flagellar motor protein MotB [Nitrospinota bacterium]
MPGENRNKQRKQKEYERGVEAGINDSLWLMTFGDMATLLLTFFVLLLSMSVPDKDRLRETISVIQRALSIQVSAPKLQILYDRLNEVIIENNLKNFVSVEQTSRGVRLNILGDFAFKSGQSTLTEKHTLVLDEVAPILNKVRNKVEISGHTDVVPVSGTPFQSNWELSAARAASVARYLEKNWGIQGARMISVGRGEFNPVFLPPNIPENMKRNRRVEIEILEEIL